MNNNDDMMYICPENEMPCDCCGAETNDIVWDGETDDIGDKGMFLCPICIKLDLEQRFISMLLNAKFKFS